jgi:hypothetical protein
MRKPWVLFWLPYFALLVLFVIDDGSGLSPAWGRFGSPPKIAGKPAEAFGRLLDQGPDPRAARGIRQMLASVLPPDPARDVVVERFQHWTSRTPASYALGLAGAAAVPLLAPLLDHEKERVREQAALALGDVGLAAAPAVPALARLARRSPPDASSRAAMNALGDVAPSGLPGWFWKIWYEVPLLAVILLVLSPVLAARICGNLARSLAEKPETPIPAPPPAAALVLAGAAAVLLLAIGLTDLLGTRLTIESDVWSLALGVWCAGALLVGMWLRRRATLRPRAS